ncbi:MAG: pyruvate kinase [Planctomycetota bacterium]|jgi:pyruvate kinase
MRKTKIVCTLGPASSDAATIAKLIDAGMDVARLNFSHGTLESHGETMARVREASRAAGKPVAVLQDLPGPKIRTGTGPDVELEEGAEVSVFPGMDATEPGRIGCTYADLGRELSADKRILLSDGLFELEVLDSKPEEIRCRVARGGTLRARQGMNLPGAELSARPPTERDLELLQWGLDAGVDYVALSFVKGGEDIARAREAAGKRARDVRFIAKIEREEALSHLDGILEETDAVMIARGDLGVELPPERVPNLQRDLIRRANAADKPVITATQMLESMIEHARPTRAEVSDVAHAIWDGTDAVMLSGETATGRYPVESASLMSRIAEWAEREAGACLAPVKRHAHTAPEDVIGMAAELVARYLGSKAVVAATLSGDTARYASMARPACAVVALSPLEATRRRMALYRGVIPAAIDEMKDTETLAAAARRAVALLFGDDAGIAVVVYGEPVGTGVKANTVRLVSVGAPDASASDVGPARGAGGGD